MFPPDGDHEYKYGLVPPFALADAEPFACPLQVIFDDAVIEDVGPVVLATATDARTVHPAASVIVTE